MSQIKSRQCKLCLRDAQLCKSHIIPEFAYERIYINGKLKPISTDGTPTRHSQKGIYEELLCSKCENRLSIWESELKKFPILVLKGDPKRTQTRHLVIHKFTRPERITEIKLAIISVFWRASISTKREFRNYNFGPYNEIIRLILNSVSPETSLEKDDFPIICTKVMLNNEPAEIIETFSANSVKIGGKASYSLIFCGMRYRIIITRSKVQEAPDTITLNGNPLYMMEEQILDKAIDDNVRKRLKDPDVKRFYHWAESLGSK